MERDWEKYHSKNLYSECQLVTALNANYYLTGEYINQDSEEYEKLVDLCLSRHGSAICIEKVWDKLNIEVKNMYSYMPNYDNEDDPPLPLEIMVWHKIYGFHSVLAVDYEPITESLRIPNFRYVTNLNGWIFYEDLMHFVIDNADKTEPRYKYRHFGLNLDGQI